MASSSTARLPCLLALGALLGALGGCGGSEVTPPGGDPPPTTPEGPTYHTDIEPILRRSCVGCHHDSGLAPFSLATYADAKEFAMSLPGATRSGLMPPFGAETTDECQPEHPWRDDPRLSEAEIDLLQAWYDAETPEGVDTGDPSAPAPSYTFELPGVQKEVAPAAAFLATGDSDIFRCFVLDPELTADTYLNGAQVLPGNPSVVHHAVLFSDPEGASTGLADADGGYDCFGGADVPGAQIVDVWVPGSPPREYPPDVGIPLTAGTKLVMQIHYHPLGASPEPDSTRLQLRFVDAPSYQLVTIGMGNYSGPSIEESYGIGELLPGPNDEGGVEFRVPAHAADHTESMRLTLGLGDDGEVPPIYVFGVFNHMHYVGTDMRLSMKHADRGGAEECLLHTPHWDFSWQRFYAYDRPIEQLTRIGPGDVFEMFCKYDNSLGNPYVMRALKEQGMMEPIDVHLGEQTLDEMCVSALQVVVPLPAL
jgi:hypothetical protein